MGVVPDVLVEVNQGRMMVAENARHSTIEEQNQHYLHEQSRQLKVVVPVAAKSMQPAADAK